jgi:hypothetical protein
MPFIKIANTARSSDLVIEILAIQSQLQNNLIGMGKPHTSRILLPDRKPPGSLISTQDLLARTQFLTG